MSFPAHFPNGCPPDTVEDAHGEVFRFVRRNDPPVAANFVSNVAGSKWYDPAKECQACGLSVLRTEQDVREARRVSPWAKKQKVATVGAADLTTTNGHYVWFDFAILGEYDGTPTPSFFPFDGGIAE